MRFWTAEYTLGINQGQCYRFLEWQKYQKCRHLPLCPMSRFRDYSLSRRPQCHSGHAATPYKRHQRHQRIQRGSHTDSLLHSQRAPTQIWGQLNPYSPLKDIAVIGGGVTGLASAYYLSNALPEARITIYEARDGVGGWLQTKHIDTNFGNVIFEQGPRTLRVSPPAGLLTLELIRSICLEDEIITPKDLLAAQNRYIYYPDHLVRMPGLNQSFFENFKKILMEPLFRGVVSAMMTEYRAPSRPLDLEDESIGSLLQRRLGTTEVGDNIVSAVLHGIYGGDIYRLSAKSLAPQLWFIDGQYGSLLAETMKNLFSGGFLMRQRDNELYQDLHKKTQSLHKFGNLRLGSVYSFKNGISTLAEQLEKVLKSKSNVVIKTNHKINKLQYDGETSSMKVTLNGPSVKYDRVISTIPSRSLVNIIHEDNTLPSLRNSYSVTIMVVNLYYTNPSLLPVRGFGYLIPRSIPWDQNPECALGVVFDSDACQGQDTAPGTKVTVMLGGHWWDPFDVYPDADEGAAMAKAILERHLNIKEEPSLVNVALQRDCIPQYTVGHNRRMKTAHYDLVREFNGRLAVAGSSYTGVALNDCVRSARAVSAQISNAKGDTPVTGLEQFSSDEKFVRSLIKRSP